MNSYWHTDFEELLLVCRSPRLVFQHILWPLCTDRLEYSPLDTSGISGKSIWEGLYPDCRSVSPTVDYSNKCSDFVKHVMELLWIWRQSDFCVKHVLYAPLSTEKVGPSDEVLFWKFYQKIHELILKRLLKKRMGCKRLIGSLNMFKKEWHSSCMNSFAKNFCSSIAAILRGEEWKDPRAQADELYHWNFVSLSAPPGSGGKTRVRGLSCLPFHKPPWQRLWPQYLRCDAAAPAETPDKAGRQVLFEPG